MKNNPFQKFQLSVRNMFDILSENEWNKILIGRIVFFTYLNGKKVLWGLKL